jgi:hypothetical protein
MKTGSSRSSPTSTISDETELPIRSVSLPQGHPGYMRSPDQNGLPRRSNSVSYTSSGFLAKNAETMSPIAQHSIHMTPINFSTKSSLPSNEGFSKSSPMDLDSTDGLPALASNVSSDEQQVLMVTPS